MVADDKSRDGGRWRRSGYLNFMEVVWKSGVFVL
jgi:hypothetical protein